MSLHPSRNLAFALFLLFPATVAYGLPTTADAEAVQSDLLTRLRALSDAFVAGKTDLVWQALSPNLQVLYGTPAEFRALRADLARDAGTELALIDEYYDPSRRSYLRVAAWSTPGTR